MNSCLRKLKDSLQHPAARFSWIASVRPEYAVQYVSHTIPGVMRPEQTVAAAVRLKNTGGKVWCCRRACANPVELVLRWDGSPVRTVSLPGAEVPVDSIVDVPIDFCAPAELGMHILSVDLVEQNVTLFEDQGVSPLHRLIRVDPAAELADTAVAQIPPSYSAAYLEHNLPEVVVAGSRLGGWLRICNTGSLLWRNWQCDPKHPVDLLLGIDGWQAATIHLPASLVRTGETVTVYFAVALPLEPGKYTLQFSLVRQNDSFFADHGVAPLLLDLTVSPEAPVQSEICYERALRLNSWFYMPSHGVARNAAGSRFPVFAARAKGCTLWDMEGNSYVDYTMGWGCALLGYGEDRVNESVRRALDYGVTLPLPHPLLLDVSEMLCDDIPSAEMTAFGKNGSDVCSLAVRLARVATGRRKVLVCGYHGFQDWYAELAGFAYSGVPERDEPLVFRFRFNDLAQFRQLIQCHGSELAAVILEPSGPGEDAQGPDKEADPIFLAAVAAETRQAGAILIFDEIITGFRYLGGSAQRHTGVVPDLTCLGKALGNGMPIAALVGRREFMSANMPHSFYGPTFKDETLSLAAAKTCLEIYRAEPVSRHVWDFGARMIREVNAVCSALALPAAMVGPAFRYAFRFQETDEYRLIQLRTLYQQELIKRGVLTYNGIMLPSYSHGEEVYIRTMQAIEGALETVGKALQEGNLHRFIEMPLISR